MDDTASVAPHSIDEGGLPTADNDPHTTLHSNGTGILNISQMETLPDSVPDGMLAPRPDKTLVVRAPHHQLPYKPKRRTKNEERGTGLYG